MSEIDALRELSDLKVSLSYDFWDNAAYVALFAVFIGVVVESVVELTGWPRDAVRRAKLGKAGALILIAGLGGDIVTHAKNNAINGTIFGFLHKKAGDAYSIGNKANERAEALAVEVQVLRGQNDKLEIDNQIFDKKLEKAQADLTKALSDLDKMNRPREVKEDNLQQAMKKLKRNLRNATIIRLDDREAGPYADSLARDLNKLQFKVEVEHLGTSSSTGVIVCENSAGDLKVFSALKRAKIATSFVKLGAKDRPSFCDHRVSAPLLLKGVGGFVLNLVGNLVGTILPIESPRLGTVIFVGQSPLPQ